MLPYFVHAFLHPPSLACMDMFLLHSKFVNNLWDYDRGNLRIHIWRFHGWHSWISNSIDNFNTKGSFSSCWINCLCKGHQTNIWRCISLGSLTPLKSFSCLGLWSPLIVALQESYHISHSTTHQGLLHSPIIAPNSAKDVESRSLVRAVAWATCFIYFLQFFDCHYFNKKGWQLILLTGTQTVMLNLMNEGQKIGVYFIRNENLYMEGKNFLKTNHRGTYFCW